MQWPMAMGSRMPDMPRGGIGDKLQTLIKCSFGTRNTQPLSTKFPSLTFPRLEPLPTDKRRGEGEILAP